MIRVMRTIRRHVVVFCLGVLILFSGVSGYRALTLHEDPQDERAVLNHANELLDTKVYYDALKEFQRVQDTEPFNSPFDAIALYNTAHVFWVTSGDIKPLLEIRQLYIEALRIRDDEDTRKNLEIVTRILQKAQGPGQSILGDNGDYGVGDDTSGF